jgi:hypothetical protein
MANPTSTDLYLQFLSALQGAIQLPGDPQVISPFQIWDWGGTQGGLAGMTYPQYMALDQVPRSPTASSNSWGTSPGFDSIYNGFLTVALNPFPAAGDPEYVSLQNTVSRANGTVGDATATAVANYRNFVQSTSSTESFSQWLANEGAVYQTGIATAQAALTTAQNALNGYVASKSTAVSNATAAYAKNLGYVTSPITNQPVQAAGWAVSEAAYDYVNKITRNNPGGTAVAGNAQSFDVNQSTSQYNYQKQWGGGGLDGIFDFFAGWGEGEWSSVSTSQFSSSYDLKFSFGDLSVIGVAPGQWWTQGVVSLLGKNGPYNQGYSGFQSGNNTFFFGPGGQLQRMITGLVVGYQPSVAVTAGGSFAQQLKSQWESSGGILIGPFGFGASAGGNSENDTFNAQGATATVTNNGAWPYILAFVTNWVQAPPT